MTDNELFALLRVIILAGLAARGLNGWDVARSNEPTQQGANSQPTVYLFKLFDHRHGSPAQVDKWDEPAQVMRRIVTQQYETTFQASVLLNESTNEFALTPSDALSAVADMIQTDEGMTALQAAGVGVLRVAEVRNPYNENDRGQFAAAPSFDFVLTYRRTRDASGPYAVAVDTQFKRV